MVKNCSICKNEISYLDTTEYFGRILCKNCMDKELEVHKRLVAEGKYTIERVGGSLVGVFIGLVIAIIGIMLSIDGLSYMNNTLVNIRNMLAEIGITRYDNQGMISLIIGIALIILGIVIVLMSLPEKIKVTKPFFIKSNDDMYYDLEKLGRLKEQGILSEDEFNEQKKILLSKISDK